MTLSIQKIPQGANFDRYYIADFVAETLAEKAAELCQTPANASILVYSQNHRLAKLLLAKITACAQEKLKIVALNKNESVSFDAGKGTAVTVVALPFHADVRAETMQTPSLVVIDERVNVSAELQTRAVECAKAGCDVLFVSDGSIEQHVWFSECKELFEAAKR